ncbi:MAG: hypothetical protein INR65_06825 [Gluconacetobacter diazotrophicus]|nr:hypothetical protein [Gluconacetobacter diazotrophicus]
MPECPDSRFRLQSVAMIGRPAWPGPRLKLYQQQLSKRAGTEPSKPIRNPRALGVGQTGAMDRAR